MAKISLNKITSLGEELYSVREEIRAIEEGVEKMTEDLKKKRDELQEKLLKSLQDTGLASIKTAAGDSFIVAKRTAFKFNTPISFEKAAKDLDCLRPDSTLLKTKLGEMVRNKLELPPGVSTEEIKYISVRKAKKNDEAGTTE